MCSFKCTTINFSSLLHQQTYIQLFSRKLFMRKTGILRSVHGAGSDRFSGRMPGSRRALPGRDTGRILLFGPVPAQILHGQAGSDELVWIGYWVYHPTSKWSARIERQLMEIDRPTTPLRRRLLDIVRTSFGLVEIVFVKKMWNVDDIERFGENRW